MRAFVKRSRKPRPRLTLRIAISSSGPYIGQRKTIGKKEEPPKAQ